MTIADFVGRFFQSSELSRSPSFQKDLATFLEALNDSFSLTSKRPNLWRHLASCFGEGIERHIAEFNSDVAICLFTGLDLSSPGGANRSFKPIVVSSSWAPQLDEWVSGTLRKNIREREVGCVPCESRRRRSAAKLVEIEGSIRAWEVNFEFALKAEAERHPNVSQTASYIYIDCMKTLFSGLLSLRSYREIKALEEKSHTFCELCWRLSMRSAYLTSRLEQKHETTENPFELSSRFCTDHDPSRAGSKYRTDIRHKQEFKRELRALKKFGKSSYQIALTVPSGADESEIRKTAYDLVHSGMKRSRRGDGIGLGTCELVYIELQSGLNQSQIARKLGISRQAVSKAVKKLQAIADRRRRLAELDPDTGSIVRLSIH